MISKEERRRRCCKPPYLPSEEEILAQCLALRKNWSQREEAIRRGASVDRREEVLWEIPQGLTMWVDPAYAARKRRDRHAY